MPLPRRLLLGALLCLSFDVVARAQIFQTLVSFDGPNGATPAAPLIQGADGDLYGTTHFGGTYNAGTVFKITPEGSLTTLHSFALLDGVFPWAGLVQATDGDFYGTTWEGGAGDRGTVFKMTPEGALTVLHSFIGYLDGLYPYAGLVQATDGDLYGTTQGGGVHNGGTVFKVTPQGTLTILYTFCSQPACTDGASPWGGLVQGTDGNFYGTTESGGSSLVYGTVFKITAQGTLTVLHSFQKTDGANPYAGLVQGTDGNFYGTTESGGNVNLAAGTVFKITPQGALTTLYSFSLGNADGAYPYAGLVQGTDRDFYGTTTQNGVGGYGAAFKITPEGALTTLYSFCFQMNCADGAAPLAGLVQATDGKFYGTTSALGSGNSGTVFSLDARSEALSVIKVGSGTVTSADGYINCGATCSYTYLIGNQVTLTATPNQHWVFTSWVGCDQTQANVCMVTMNNARNVTATFTIITHPLSVSKIGTGTVTSVDGHIYCGSVCSYPYGEGTEVTLSALPAPGYTFTGWTGCDNMNGSYCSVTMTGAKNVTATFTTANITLTSLTFKPSYVKGGQLSAGTLTLSAAAPPGGVTVALSSDHPGVAHPPSFVFVPGNASSVQFAVNTLPVKSNTTVTITATAGASQVSGTLTVGTTSLPPSPR